MTRPWLVLRDRICADVDGRGRESGSAVVEFVFLGVLMLLPLLYLVLCLGRLEAGAYAVSSSVREAGRAFVTAPDEPSAGVRARAAADLALSNLGFGGAGTLWLTCSATPCLTPGGSVTSTAEVRVPLPLVPAFARSVVPLEIPLSATNLQRVDAFRGAR